MPWVQIPCTGPDGFSDSTWAGDTAPVVDGNEATAYTVQPSGTYWGGHVYGYFRFEPEHFAGVTLLRSRLIYGRPATGAAGVKAESYFHVDYATTPGWLWLASQVRLPWPSTDETRTDASVEFAVNGDAIAELSEYAHIDVGIGWTAEGVPTPRADVFELFLYKWVDLEPEPEAVPFWRQYPRSDGLGPLPAHRIHPPPRSVQGSPRRGGGTYE
jgi:hypothetical protein